MARARTRRIGEAGAREDAHLSVGGSTVELMDEAEHWAAWLHRYGDDYSTDEERRAAYRDAQATLATLTEVFATGEDHRNR
jgi:hypothetical protein